MSISAHSDRGKGVNTKDCLVFTCHHASLQAEFVETIGGSAVSVELEFELHIVLGLPDHPHEET